MPEINERSEFYDPKHALIDYTLGPNYTMMLLGFFIIFLFWNIFTKILKKIGECFGCFK